MLLLLCSIIFNYLSTMRIYLKQNLFYFILNKDYLENRIKILTPNKNFGCLDGLRSSSKDPWRSIDGRLAPFIIRKHKSIYSIVQQSFTYVFIVIYLNLTTKCTPSFYWWKLYKRIALVLNFWITLTWISYYL
jgi:hypothetical protein